MGYGVYGGTEGTMVQEVEGVAGYRECSGYRLGNPQWLHTDICSRRDMKTH
jgi:hypothetical protein